MAENETGEACIHACSFGCGRKYDVIVTQVVDGSTLFLCMPDLVSFVRNVAQSMVEPDSPEIQEVVQNADLADVVVVTEPDPGYAVRGNSDPTAEDEFEFDGMSEE